MGETLFFDLAIRQPILVIHMRTEPDKPSPFYSTEPIHIQSKTWEGAMRVFPSISSPAEQSIANANYVNNRNRANAAFVCNHLLAALPDEELDQLGDHLKFVYLEAGTEVCGEDGKSPHVYFPTTAIIAMLHRMVDGTTLEIGAIGCEGMVGASAFHDKGGFGTAIVQFEGGAYRADLCTIENLCRQGGQLQSLLMHYTWAFLSQVLRSSMSSRHYSVEQRLSCWLLERLDRLPTNELKMTQEVIAGMLGVRRESITESIGKLREKGMVHCRRGSITVLDRDSLEQFSGECYQGKAYDNSMR